MYRYINGAIVAIGLAGATLAISAPASAQVGIGVNVGGIGVGVGIGVGDVAYGYRDGYWDRSHQWHHWQNEQQATYYRGAPGNQYYDWNHDRDRDMGWHEMAGAPGVGVVFDVNEVAFGYQDGYWDRGHRWHDWRNGEMAHYRNAPGNQYHDWNHDRDGDHGWHS
jgi:hypothetical protein